MSDNKDDFRLRPGRIRSARSGKPKTFLNEVMRATKKAGSHSTVSIGGSGVAIGRSTFGRGRNVFGRSRISGSSRRVTIKTRITRQQGKAYRSTALPKHLTYLKREGVTRDGDRAEMFDAASDQANESAFVERCKDDRHLFRFIIAPEDAAEMEDLRSFTRDLASQMEKDLGTKLDWVAVDHWNTDNPHVHLLVRGVDETGADLVISRDYISHGIRSRAEDLASLELGPKPEHEIRASLERETIAERWTSLDRQIKSLADEVGVIDLRPERTGPEDPLVRRLMVRRLAKERGRTFNPTSTGGSVSGAYRETIRLSSGRFAMINDGLGFQLVPWSPSLEKNLDRQVSGIARSDGGVDWRLGRSRGLGL